MKYWSKKGLKVVLPLLVIVRMIPFKVAVTTISDDSILSNEIVARFLAEAKKEATTISLDEPVGIAETENADAIELAKTMAPSTTDEKGYNADRITVIGNTVVLKDNFSFSQGTIKLNGNVTLDLDVYELNMGDGKISVYGNNTITGEGTSKLTKTGTSQLVQVNSGGTLTIDGEVNIIGTSYAVLLNNGNLDIKGGTLSNSISNKYAVYVYDQGTSNNARITMEGGLITGYNGIYGAKTSSITITGGTIETVYNSIALFDSPNLKISGGDITSENGAAVITNGSETQDATIDITGGTLTSKNTVCMYLPGGGTTTITSGVITGGLGIVVRGGDLKIGGDAKIEATAASDVNFKIGDVPDSDLVPAGSVIVDKHANYPEVNVTIESGEFKGNVLYVKSADGTNMVPEAEGNLVVKGGTFSNSLLETDYLDSQLTAELARSVGEAETFNYYKSVEDALEDMEAGDKVTSIIDEEEDTVTIIYKDNLSNNTVTYSVNRSEGTITLRDKLSTNDEYSFIGWKNENTIYSVGSVITLEDGVDDLLFTAVWKADATELEKLVNSVKQLSKGSYTTESWNALKTALANAETVLQKIDASKEEIDAAIEALTTARINLKESNNTLNKTSLKNAIDQAKALDEFDYTEESWQVLKEALKQAEKIYNAVNTTQGVVNSVRESLQKAIASLVEQTPDMTMLKRIIREAEALDKNDYTVDSWTSLEEALRVAQTVASNDSARDEEIKDAIESLRKAIESLVKRVDKTSLRELIEFTDSLKEEDYTPNSWKTFEDALKIAKAIVMDEHATKETVDETTESLKKAIDSLLRIANKTELKNAIETAKSLNENDYTADSWNAFKGVLASAEETLENKNASQKEVDDARNSIKNAISSLVKKSTTTTPPLEEQPSKPEDSGNTSQGKDEPTNNGESNNGGSNTGSSGNNSSNTGSSGNSESSNNNNSNKGSSNNNSSNAGNNNTSNQQTEANDNQKDKDDKETEEKPADEKEKGEFGEANKDDLEKAITDAELLFEYDYTEESWGELKSALEEAQSVLEDDYATQKEVAEAVGKIRTAIANLQKDVENKESKKEGSSRILFILLIPILLAIYVTYRIIKEKMDDEI